MKRRSSYKVTFLDRHGPAGVHAIRAAGYAAVVFALSIVMFATLGSNKFGLEGWRLLGFTLASATTLAGLSMLVGLRTGQAASDVAKYFTAGGSSTPYLEQFSQMEARVMQRDYAGALALYEARIRELPDDARVRIAAADLYATHGENAERAAELYREVQRLPSLNSGQDVYVSNKLADLYLGPLNNPGRALVQFRRLAHRYPNTPHAEFAKKAIANLKADVVKDPSVEY